MEGRKATEPRIFLVFAALTFLFLLFSYEKPAEFAELREYTGRFESVEWVRHSAGGHHELRMQDGSVFYMQDETARILTGWNVRKGSILRILAGDRGMHSAQVYEIWWKNREWELVSYEETVSAIQRDQRMIVGILGGLTAVFCALYFMRSRQAWRKKEEENEK